MKIFWREIKKYNFNSSANAKKWEIELNSLKTTNARLTSALQESTANVEEWKKQLQTYKEENSRMKNRIMELEGGRGKIIYYSK